VFIVLQGLLLLIFTI